MRRSIALVDDDRNIRTSVAMALEAEGFDVRTYVDGEQAWRALSARPVDLAVLDIKMPRLNGIELLEKLRGVSTLPVIFLTTKNEDADEELGLSLGADDYIRKPFSQRLLVARIRALLRRKEMESGEVASKEALQRGDLIVDPARHRCSWKGRPVPLTVTELLIVKSLAQRPGLVKSRNRLMDDAYGDDVYVDDRTIDSHIKRMRRKFRNVDADFSAIETLYGLGYRYRL